MVTANRARLLDEASVAAIAVSDGADLDGWWCRADGAVPFRRGNAALPPPVAGADERTDADLDESISRVANWYRSRGVPPRIQVSTADPTWRRVDDRLASAGFEVEAPVTVLVAPVSVVTSTSRGPVRPDSMATVEDAVRGTSGVDVAWATEAAALHGDDARARARTLAYGRMLAGFGADALGATASLGGRPAAAGFAVRDRRWCGVFGMTTAPPARRRGLGGQVLRALARLAGERGATDLYLQLEDDNRAAEALYRGHGFSPSHRYHYRTLLEP